MTPAIKSKPKKNPVYMECFWAIDEATGAKFAAFRAANECDKDMLRARGIRPGDRLRAQVTKSRDEVKHRKIHALGKMMIENHDDFRLIHDYHEAVKKLQKDSRVRCEVHRVDVGPVELELVQPQSIAFDAMKDEEFTELFTGICGYIRDKYFPDMELEQVEEMAKLFERELP